MPTPRKSREILRQRDGEFERMKIPPIGLRETKRHGRRRMIWVTAARYKIYLYLIFLLVPLIFAVGIFFFFFSFFRNAGDGLNEHGAIESHARLLAPLAANVVFTEAPPLPNAVIFPRGEERSGCNFS